MLNKVFNVDKKERVNYFPHYKIFHLSYHRHDGGTLFIIVCKMAIKEVGKIIQSGRVIDSFQEIT